MSTTSRTGPPDTEGNDPSSFMVKWKALETPDSRRSNRRRPAKACLLCRAAKVRCDGHRQCSRCAKRQTTCQYLDASSSSRNNSVAITIDGSQDAQLRSTAPAESSSLSTAAAVGIWDSVPTYQPQNAGTADWQSPGMDLHLATLAESAISTDTSEPNVFESIPDFSTPQAAKPSASQAFSSVPCACRTRLAAVIPQIKPSLEGDRPDKVLSTADDVLNGCLGVIECEVCEVNCTDLLSIMAVFKHCLPCFEYMAAADLTSINLKFGGFHEIQVSDPTLGFMHAMNLIQQAIVVLDNIGGICQTRLASLGLPPSILTQINSAQVRGMIHDSKIVLERVAVTISGSNISIVP